ncbi:MAG: hypothetical protein IKX58_03780 [Clostridia bacterium]|nr:hypothetical protein [Clostridia bacterium]
MMIQKKKKRKKRARNGIRPMMIIIPVALLAVIAAVIFLLLRNGREETASADSMQFTLNNKSAVIIRDEYTYIASEHTKTDFKKEERSAVHLGDSLATVYKLGYSDELMQSLLNAREDVYKAQVERIGSTKDSKLDEINDGIKLVKKQIEACVMRSSEDDLETLYRSLDELLKQRMEYLQGKVQETEKLRALYSAVSAKEDLISTWTEEVISAHEGIVSYYFDGYEQAMNAGKMNMLTADLVNRAAKGKGAANWTTDDKTRVCRIINPNKWYVAFTTKGESLSRVSSGIAYEVRIKGYGNFMGIGLEPIISGNEIINLIEFNTDLGGLIEARSVSVSVKADVSGIKVKASAITVENNLPYIELIMPYSHNMIQVDVLAVEDKMAIVRTHDGSGSLTEGVKYWNKKR